VRRSLGLLLAVAVVAACGSGGDDDERSTETTVEVSTTTSTATTLATTTTITFELEVRRAAVELLEIRNDVLMNPDVSRVSEYISDTCVCLEQERGFVADLVTATQRWGQTPLEPLGVLVTASDNVEPGLTIVARQPGGEIEDSAGIRVAPVPEVELAPIAVTLVRAGGEWRFNLFQPIELPRESAERVAAGGLP
jgi:hypothetical protein